MGIPFHNRKLFFHVDMRLRENFGSLWGIHGLSDYLPEISQILWILANQKKILVHSKWGLNVLFHSGNISSVIFAISFHVIHIFSFKNFFFSGKNFSFEKFLAWFFFQSDFLCTIFFIWFFFAYEKISHSGNVLCTIFTIYFPSWR